jgi:hypothetical protein
MWRQSKRALVYDKIPGALDDTDSTEAGDTTRVLEGQKMMMIPIRYEVLNTY